MYPSVREVFSKVTRDLEGVVPYMYLDVTGLVTTGTGNLIDSGKHPAAKKPYAQPTEENAPTLPFDVNNAAQSALALDWRKVPSHAGTSPANDGDPIASKDDVIAEWNAIKSRRDMALGGGGSYWKVANLRLTQKGIDQLFSRTLDNFEAALKGNLSDWESWPADAQLATLLMAWAFGPGFSKSWPKWRAAATAQDFETAAEESKNNTLAAARQNAIVTSFHNAAEAIKGGADRSVVHYSAVQHAENKAKAAVTNIVEDPATVAKRAIEEEKRKAEALGQAMIDKASDAADEVGATALAVKGWTAGEKVAAGIGLAVVAGALYKVFSK